MATDTRGPEGAAAAVASAKDALAKGSKLTQSVEGNPTSSFAPKAESAPESNSASYKMAHAARKGGAEPVSGATSNELNTALNEHARNVGALHQQ